MHNARKLHLPSCFMASLNSCPSSRWLTVHLCNRDFKPFRDLSALKDAIKVLNTIVLSLQQELENRLLQVVSENIWNIANALLVVKDGEASPHPIKTFSKTTKFKHFSVEMRPS